MDNVGVAIGIAVGVDKVGAGGAVAVGTDIDAVGSGEVGPRVGLAEFPHAYSRRNTVDATAGKTK